MKSFFTPVPLKIADTMNLVPACGACGLYKKCRSPKMEVSGRGKKKILIVTEYPNEIEDLKGKQLVGDAGQLLSRTLMKFGIDLREDCWTVHAVICRPEKDKLSEKRLEIQHCRPNLINTIRRLNPENILLFGGVAVESLIPYVWKKVDKKEPIETWIGWNIPCQKLNAWISPNYSPTHVIEKEQQRKPVTRLWFERYVERAVKKVGKRPWKRIPNFESEIEVILDGKKAARRIAEIAKSGRVAFDYETVGLKPEEPNARIVCCSVSNGKETIAYPWTRETRNATVTILTDATVCKIASNLKFEQRMTTGLLGVRVNNWKWDTMLSSHHLWNWTKTRHITSIKFLSFVLLGQGDYDSQIEPYLSDVTKAPAVPLMKYCGMDSLLEYKVAEIQDKDSNYES